MTKKYRQLLLLIFIALLFVSCAAHQPAGQPGAPGFWLGIWHGIAAPFAFIISLFKDSLRIYAFPNCGKWYDLGFMLGISIWGGGGCSAAKRSKK